jgi:hypothetical protein
MPTVLTNKIFSLYVKVFYSRAPSEYKYFYRDTLSCKLVQWKYAINDYIFRQKYKHIVYNGEFGQELLFVLPFAYWHSKNGTLKSTKSCKFTKELYFFSPNHVEEFSNRTNVGNYNFEIPRILYSHDYNISKWEPVPLKNQYKNEIYKFDKPILIIANRYNMEWDGPPISYFDIPILDYIMSNLKHDYTIIYNRPRPENIIEDNSESYDLGEYEWLRFHHPEVILMENLLKENKAGARNFNHLQLMVYANSNHFISIHGGTATLASYFGGTNLILSKQGGEHHFGCFTKLFPKLSGATILHARNDEEVREYIDSSFIVDRGSSNNEALEGLSKL